MQPYYLQQTRHCSQWMRCMRVRMCVSQGGEDRQEMATGRRDTTVHLYMYSTVYRAKGAQVAISQGQLQHPR